MAGLFRRSNNTLTVPLQPRPNVSISAQPFFQHFDFVIVQQQMPVVRGVALSNALMHKVLL
jgi:hypothetical protein